MKEKTISKPVKIKVTFQSWIKRKTTIVKIEVILTIKLRMSVTAEVKCVTSYVDFLINVDELLSKWNS